MPGKLTWAEDIGMKNSSQQSPLILIADANEDNLYLLTTVVQDLGFRTLALNNGTDVIKACKRYQPDLAILETHFPDVHGAEVMVAMRRSYLGANIPAIAVTSAAMDGDRARCLSMGFDNYLAKPYSIATLEQLIYQYICSKKEYAEFSRRLSQYIENPLVSSTRE